MRKLFTIPAILLVLLMLSSCSVAPGPDLPDDPPAGSTPIDPNTIKPGNVFYSFNIEQKDNYITELKAYIHVIRPAVGSGALLTVYADEREAYKESGTFIISATDQEVAFGNLGSAAEDMKVINYDETGEAEFTIDVVASTKGTLKITVADFNNKDNNITLTSTLPEGASTVSMVFQKIVDDVPFADMEVFTTSLSHRPDNL